MSGGLTVSNVAGAVAGTWAVIGAAYLWNETSPLGWRTLKPRPTEERELADFYERRQPPFPGDPEALRKYFESGGYANTILPPRRGRPEQMIKSSERASHEAHMEREAGKLWMRMRREAAKEVRAQGYDVE